MFCNIQRRYIELVRLQAERKMALEDAQNGLVVVKAVYGIVKNDGGGNTDGVKGSSVDVALALQYLVESSRMQLHSSSKAGLPGVYDAAAGEEKVLYVLYSFKGRLHEVFVDDEAPLMLPLKSHCLPDAAQRRV